jgi:hypothetical protein
MLIILSSKETTMNDDVSAGLAELQTKLDLLRRTL